MNVICTNCNWTSFAVSKEFAEMAIDEFNNYFESLTYQQQMEYYSGKGASLEDYTCQRCGGSEFKPGNTAPYGSTISPVIYEPALNSLSKLIRLCEIYETAIIKASNADSEFFEMLNDTLIEADKLKCEK